MTTELDDPDSLAELDIAPAQDSRLENSGILRDSSLEPLEFGDVIQIAIDKILPDDDPFYRADFDVTNYLNELFPTEQSLANLDDAMNDTKQRIQSIDEEIAEILQSQNTASEDGHRALAEAKAAIQELFGCVREIKAKTDHSESMVKEITRDIKQLDTAKKNLTASITTFNHLIFLLSGVETLQSDTNTRKYDEISTLLPGITNVLEHFDKYMIIPQIKDLADQVTHIKKELAEQTARDFKDYFTGSSSLPAGLITDLCQTVSVLDGSVKTDLSTWFVQQQLAEYFLLYGETEDDAWLDKLENRFNWFRDRLMAVEQKYKNLFPADWEVPKLLATEFCTRTRTMLDKLMQKRINEIDVKLLLYAIQRTTNFELLLRKRFSQQQQHFTGIISRVYDGYMHIYTTAQDRNLNTLLDQFISRLREGQYPKAETETTAVTFPTSGDLFLFYKKSIQQLTSLTTSDKALVDLALVFKKYLRDYAVRCLTNFLPKINASQALTTTGLIQSLLKEGEVPRLSNDEIFLICCILTTAEFCAETTQQLEEKLKEKITAASWNSSLDMSHEKDMFHNVTTNCIQVLVQDLDGACEPALQAMTKMAWSSFENVGDESGYVVNIKKHLRTLVPRIRNYLTNTRKYFSQLCLKFVGSFIPKFTNCLFRCKPLNVTGAEQLLLDTHALKTELLNLPCVDSAVGRKPPSAYTKVVLKGMTKAEMILKLFMCTLEMDKMEEFVEQYMRLLPESGVLEFQKILEMKSIRRSDQNQLIEMYRKKVEKAGALAGVSATGDGEGQSGRTGRTGTGVDVNNPAAPLLSLAMDGGDFGKIKKLEKLVKKRL